MIKLLYLVIFVLACVYSCRHPTATPQATIKKYERLVLEMKPDSISNLFTTDAETGHENQPSVKSGDSIYALLSSFKNIRVIENRDDISSVSVRGDSATVSGTYQQAVVVSEKDTVRVSGSFTADMLRDKNKNWLIWKMRTRSR
jgi:hypothetical protein